MLPGLNLATYGTHDHQPLKAFYESLVTWWHGDDGAQGWLEVQRLMRFLDLDTDNPPTQYTDDLACVFFKTLLASPCWLVVFMVTDLLGTKQRFNQPGSVGSDNWSERLDKAIALYEEDRTYANKISCFRGYVEQSGRASKPARYLQAKEEVYGSH
jgi:4-alpha-glucanotransferase